MASLLAYRVSQVLAYLCVQSISYDSMGQLDPFHMHNLSFVMVVKMCPEIFNEKISKCLKVQEKCSHFLWSNISNCSLIRSDNKKPTMNDTYVIIFVVTAFYYFNLFYNMLFYCLKLNIIIISYITILICK